MNERDRQAVDQAKGKTATGKSTRRSAQTAETIGNSIQEKLAETSNRLKENMKKQVVTTALVGMLEDFERGDFGDATEMFDIVNEAINSPLEVQVKALETWESSPKLLPAAESTIS